MKGGHVAVVKCLLAKEKELAEKDLTEKHTDSVPSTNKVCVIPHARFMLWVRLLTIFGTP